MKILWISNGLFPDVCHELGISVTYTGGWQFSSAKALVNTITEIRLAIAAPYNGHELKTIILNRITYFLIPWSKSDKRNEFKIEFHWKVIQLQFQPDVVHIHGTEYLFLSTYLQTIGFENVVVSIQGLVSVYARYYLGGIDKKVLRKNITLRDCIKRDTIFSQQCDFVQRGRIEKQMIQSVKHIIGRTSWDKAHTWAMNPSINYYFCNETLRNEFYQHKWELCKCEKHSIFLSQAYYPIKGLQQLIQALPIILRQFPNTKVYVAGDNFVTNRGWRLSGFGKYIRSLMKINGLTDKIIFMGKLAEKEMCERYLASHVFACPSSIENSPNSLGEAQMLGVPCIASYVGGIPDMIEDNENGLLYRFDEVEMLADSIFRIFSNDQFAEKLSLNGREVANARHNKNINSNRLFSIYKSICKNL